MRTFTFALAILMAAGAAHAEVREPASAEIAYAEQMLTTESGAQVILDGLVAQIEKACEHKNIKARLRGAIDQQCIDEFLASAVKQINSPNLTDAYLAKMGGNYFRSER
ncbi:MAG: UrcA family protein [Henriciella sp.]|nr:UrcA family protein [Henriciella sp.]